MLVLFLALACADKATDSASPDDSGSTAQPAPERPAEPAAWAAPGTVDALVFPWVPQVGDPAQDEVILSVRTDLDSVTAVVMADDGAGGWTEVARPVLTRAADSIVARATLSGLSADTVHAWAAYAEDPDLALARSEVGRFRTATGAGAFRQVIIGGTSCLGDNEPIPNMSHVAARQPDLFLLLGDFVYADGAETVDEFRPFYDETMAWQGVRDVLSTSGVVATWDDHEVDNNFVVEDLAPGVYDSALAVFRESLPQTEGPTGGIWRRQSWGDVVDIFVLDVRSERDPEAGLYIGAEQEAWLIDGVTTSTAAFKLVMTGVPITDYSDFLGWAAADDRWQGWPEQRTRVLEALRDVDGLLWVGGDVHFATVSSVDIPGSGGPGEHMWEVLAGPGGRSPNVAADLYEHDGSHYQFLFSTFNSVLMTLDPGRMTVHVEYLDDAGATIAATTVSL